MKMTKHFTFDREPLLRAFMASRLNSTQIAAQVGATAQTVDNIVSGRCPNSKLLPAICGLLGVEVESCWRPKGKLEGRRSKVEEKNAA